ncbi:hypothetical protein [Streptosporangium roseum]|uniref:hypothetical protein n=1 Tax=Streptosporangium roseum TaxID=2001 RepID=UPI0001A3EF40|nr:hypothetical protein [Streptosporangium roseum]
MEAILRAAGKVMGVELSDPADLGGSLRSTVLRCRTAEGGSVIVKAYGTGPEALRGFTAEARRTWRRFRGSNGPRPTCSRCRATPPSAADRALKARLPCH